MIQIKELEGIIRVPLHDRHQCATSNKKASGNSHHSWCKWCPKYLLMLCKWCPKYLLMLTVSEDLYISN